MKVRSLLEFDKEDLRRLGIEPKPAADLSPADLGHYYNLVWDEITRLGYISLDKLSAEGEKLVAIASPRKAAAGQLPAGQDQAAAPVLVTTQTQQQEGPEVVAPAAHPF